jgi:hypothetical protein
MRAVSCGRPRATRVLSALVAVLTLLLSSCGGQDIPPPGTPVLTLSASNTHFAGYIVSIDSITLTGANGTFATLLATAETVDLTRVTDIGELISAPAVPSGTYTSATITLDYTSSTIFANDNGSSVPLVISLPGNIAGIFATSLTVTFDPAHPLVVTAGQATRAHIKLDLDAFNTVDIPSQTVTVQPYALMSTPKLDSNPLRARGIFVYTQDSAFVMNMRPFYDLGSALGAMTVNVSPQTSYNINGTAYIGAAGLANMGSLPISTPIAAYGTLTSLDGITPSFNATSVLVGTSLESPLEDHIVGVVKARSGDSLTVIHPQYLVSSYGNAYFTAGTTNYLTTAFVKVGTATTVFEDGVATPLSAQDISVGQVVDFGGVSTLDATKTTITLDTTAGQARLLTTRAWGILNSATPNSMSMDLVTLDGFVRGVFDYAGTASGGGAVDPLNYPVNTGSIDESGTAAGTLLAVDGQVTAFGAAPPAFTAKAITPGTATEQELLVEWDGTYIPHPFTTLSATGLVVDLSNTAITSWHFIFTGPESLDLKSLPASPLITTAGAPAGTIQLALGNAGLATGVSIFSSQADYTAAITTALMTSTTKMYRLAAYGQYNSASNTFVATRVNLAFEEPAGTL